MKDLSGGEGAVTFDNPVVEFLPEPDAEYTVIENDGPVFYVATDNAAPNGRLVAIDSSVHNPADPANWREILPETPNPLQSVHFFGDQIYASYLLDAKTQIKIFTLDGTFVDDLALPGLGSAGGFGGKRDATETFYSFASYVSPPVIFRYDLQTGESAPWKRPDVAFNPDNYETHQVFSLPATEPAFPCF